jgi:hypothetical protein
MQERDYKMPLSFSNTPSGESGYTPYVRYAPSTASWQTADGVVTFTKAAFDFGSIRTGYAVFAKGEAPEWVLDPSLDVRVDKPDDGRDWKRGFQVNIMSKEMFGEDQSVREWSTTSVGATMAIQELYGKWEASSDVAGKAAVVAYNGATPTKIGRGNTNIPNFELVKLIDRPSEFGDIAETGDGGSSSPAPAAAASEPSSDDEF